MNPAAPAALTHPAHGAHRAPCAFSGRRQAQRQQLGHHGQRHHRRLLAGDVGQADGAGDARQLVVAKAALGPSLGQCCGGVVWLRQERIEAAHIEALRTRLMPATRPLALFGGGHVGRAIVRLLEDLPFAVRWVDSRDEVFPAVLPLNVQAEHSDPVQAAVAELPAGSAVLVMSFSHAEDLEVIAACLARQRERGDLSHIGLIGSRTKWARFGHRLAERGFSQAELARVNCPIGLPEIRGKQPAVVALAVVAQLLALGLAPG